MISEDNTFVDLTDLIYENNNKNNKKCFKCFKCFKCKMPQFLKDLLNLVIPAALMFGLIALICFLI